MNLLSRLAVVAVICLSMSIPVLAADETRMTFIGVALDPETREADQKLRDFSAPTWR